MMNKNNIGIDLSTVSDQTKLLVISVDSSAFDSEEKRSKTLAHVRKMTNYIDVPVIVIDRSNTSIQALNDEQLANIGLQRIDQDE